MSIPDSKRMLRTRGDKVRQARKLNNMTQTELANKSGVSYHKIIDIEKGRGAEPWCLTAIAPLIGLPLHQMAIVDTDAHQLINSTMLNGYWKAHISGIENETAARQLFDDISIQLNTIPGLQDFHYSRPHHSTIIAVRATILKHFAIVHLFAHGDLTTIRLSSGASAVIPHLYFPKSTLDWPSTLDVSFPPGVADKLTKTRTLRAAIDHYVKANISSLTGLNFYSLEVRDYPHGGVRVTLRQPKSSPTNGRTISN